MTSDPKAIPFIVDQASGACDVRTRPTFGEYGLYCDAKMMAMVCDNRLFMKPIPAGRAIAPDAGEESPDPGAKPCLLVDAEHWDDRELLAQLFRLTAAALSHPRPRANQPASARAITK